MINDPSHKAMLYFLEVLMNVDSPITVDNLAARFSHKSFSSEMREACGGGSSDALKQFLQQYPSLFNVDANGEVTSVAVELPNLDDIEELDSVAPNNGPFRLASNNHSSQCTETTFSNSLSKSGALHPHDFAMSTANRDNVHSKRDKQTDGDLYVASNELLANKSNGLYQPPQLRNKFFKSTPCDCVHVNANPCIHYPLVELACSHTHHQCATNHFHPLHHCHHHHHHHPHCYCAVASQTPPPPPPLPPPTLCSCHVPNNKTSLPVTSNWCTMSTMEKLTRETEAVRFFQQRLAKRDERWVSVKSLAGHLSQANAEIRAIVGPQLEFRKFLLKHPHVFEVQGDLVSVKNPFDTNHKRLVKERSSTHNVSSVYVQSGVSKVDYKSHRPKSLILANSQGHSMISQTESTCSNARRYNPNRRSTHFIETPIVGFNATMSKETSTSGFNGGDVSRARFDLSKSTKKSIKNKIDCDLDLNSNMSVSHSNSLSISMSADEYRAIMFLRKVLDKQGGALNQIGLNIHDLMQFLSTKAPETIQSTIGWTKMELEEFIGQHHLFFEIRSHVDPSIDEHYSTVRIRNKRLNQMINIIITANDKSADGSSVKALTNCCGRIFHVAKLWGIVDLGKHEHVFFDKSIFKHVDDLQKHFKIDEILYFNAVLAPKESRAKWRATQVWKECDRQIVEHYGVKQPTAKLTNSAAAAAATNNSNAQSSFYKTESTQQLNNNINNNNSNNDDDTEADEEIEDIEIYPSAANKDQLAKIRGDSDFEYALDEMEDDLIFAALAKTHGFDVDNDVKFLTDQVDKELEQVLQMDQDNGGRAINGDRVDELSLFEATPKVGALGVERFASLVTASNYVQSYKIRTNTAAPSDSGTSSSVSDANGVSTAVQTLSTGDIMATQLYHGHELSSK